MSSDDHTSFVRLAQDLKCAQEQFSLRFEQESGADEDKTNALALHKRLKLLRVRVGELGPKIAQIEEAKKNLLEALVGAKNVTKVVNAVPKSKRTIMEADHALDRARTAAFKKEAKWDGRS